MSMVMAYNSDYSRNDGKNAEKDNINSSKIHTPLAPSRVGL